MSKFTSLFSQMLHLFSRLEFAQAVRQHQAERHARGFTCWQQFVAMLFCQLGRAQSLREISGGLASLEGKLVHLGIRAPHRSSLSYANAHRPWQLYQSVFYQMLDRCTALVAKRQRKFRFKNKLLSLDATVIELCATVFDWALFRRTKGAIKLHLLLDHDGYLPCFAVITEGKRHEVSVTRTWRFPTGAIVVFDRAYVDYAFLGRLTDDGVFFVTRMKANAVYEVVERRPVPRHRNVVRDEVIRLTGVKAEERCPHLLRRVELYDAEQERSLVFLTNHLSFGSTTIAALYKERWQIELFFKALKQTLKIKTFIGTSANALHIQIWTALIAMLLLKYLKLRARFGWSLSNLAALLRMNLFTHRDLWAWLDAPFSTPVEQPEPEQLELNLSNSDSRRRQPGLQETEVAVITPSITMPAYRDAR